MSLPTVLRPLACLIFGHAPTVRGTAGESKADYVCERCRAVLGVFVADPSRRRAAPADGPAAAPRGASDREQDLRESTWLDDGGRNADPAAGIPGRMSARA